MVASPDCGRLTRTTTMQDDGDDSPWCCPECGERWSGPDWFTTPLHAERCPECGAIAEHDITPTKRTTTMQTWKPGEYRWTARSNRYRLVVCVSPGGGVLLTFPDWYWCAEWSEAGDPPAAGWLAEHRFSDRLGDCEGAADGLARVWAGEL